jgi:release factor glutamine methyltransferase
MIKKILDLAHPVLKGIYNWYNSRTRKYDYKGIEIQILPGVFHPGLFFSTKYLLEFSLENISNHEQKNLLELGAGSGLISVVFSKKGMNVFASDINPESIRNVEANARSNNLKISTYLSDLFDEIPVQPFDVILINPPYYRKEPMNEPEMAWYCGEDFEFFKKLFTQLGNYMQPKSNVLMVLSEDCEVDAIKDIANDCAFKLKVANSKKINGERNMIFYINKINELKN